MLMLGSAARVNRKKIGFSGFKTFIKSHFLSKSKHFFAEVHCRKCRIRWENKSFDDMGTLSLPSRANVLVSIGVQVYSSPGWDSYQHLNLNLNLLIDIQHPGGERCCESRMSCTCKNTLQWHRPGFEPKPPGPKSRVELFKRIKS